MEWRPTSLCVLVLALTWGLQVNAIRVRRSNHLDNVCSMWGNFHFKTFDGDVYQFQGICEYNLVSHCHGSVQDFSVHVKRSEFTGDSKINRVLVTIGDMAIKLTKNLVMVNDDVVKLPHYVAGVLLEQYATYIKLYAKLGLSVMWNKDDAVMVELEAKYTNQTCGLCGDFNGMAILNEFISEAREIGPIEFGNKHRIHNPNSQCEDLYEEDEPSTPGKCQAFRPGCSELLEDKAWKSCTSIVSPEPYIQACVVDRCWSRPGDIEDSLPLCTTLSEYSRQCSHAGGTPPNWRKPDFCAVKCPYNMEYSESGSPCVDTCSHTDTSLLCEEHKMDGCYCPPGTVFDDISDRGCIPQEQCQCKHNKVYNSGDVLHMEDKECVCHHGSWTCESLPTPGLCAVEEGSHFTTFDGKEFTFHGECYYILSQDCEESKFTVLGQLIPCVDHETDTCLKSVVLLPNNDKNNALVIKDDGTVKQNGDLTLPYASANIIVFRPSSFHIIVQTSFGLRMQVQLVPVMQLYITLDRSYQTKTCGLCGNFNMVLSDELKTPQGLVEGTASSFANSWKAQSNCRDRSESLDDPCSYNIDSESYAEHWCSKLLEKEGPFAKCHSSVNPESYYKRCKYSTCTCEKTENCLCGVFSSYVRACTAKGIFLQGWRDTVCKKYTEHCPATQTFSYKLQGCQRTCDSLSLERPACINTYLPVDGCACPDGLYENENGVCVALDKCSCYHNGERIKPGKSITIKNEHCVCTNGKLHCHSWKPSVMDCPAPKVFFNCSEAGPEEHGLECAKTCAQKTVDCFLTGCTSGCQCPSGLLDDGRGHCVPQHNCPCKHNGHYYPPGSQITDQCNTCTCKQGKWKCTEEKCPGTCTIYGSGHYNTFDNRRFGFSGDCGYIAAQNKCGNKTGTFHVITENVPCGTTGTTCSKSVRIVLGKTQLDLIDGKVTNTDLESGTLIKYRVRNVGLYLAIEADIGLTVLWDRKTTVRIILQPQHMGEVCGLCGNFNGNGKDDFTTQGQLQVSDVLEFANSWKVNSHCPDAVPDFDPCSKAHNRHTWAKMQCSIITGKTFKECHSMVDPAPYFDNCVRDSCACDTGGDCECFCTAVAAYAQACNEAGVCVAWRTPEICPVFCEFYNDPLECLWHYSPCHTPCYKTCLNPDGICRNPLPNLEGCYPTCPEDKPIFDEEKKICVEKCEGCFINGTEYETGEEIPSDKPCTLCFCDEHGRATCSPREGCCFYNGTEYGDTDVIYNVTDNMGMCYYAICINSTVIETSEPCRTTPSTTPEPTTTFTTSTTEVSTTEVTSTTTITTTTPTPTSTTQTLPTPTVSQETTPCIICDWTEWFNVYDPVTGKGNDLETYENIRDAGKTICETPEDIECKAVSNPDMSLDEFVQETGQVVHCNVSFGLVCKKDDQENSPYKCLDYTIRALCCRPCESTPSPTTTITTPKETTTSQTTPYPGSEGTTPTTTRGTTTPEVITIPTTPHPGPTPTSTPTTTTTTTTREVTYISTTTPEIEQTTTPGTTTKATTTTEVITEPTTPHPEPTPSSTTTTTTTTTPEIEQTTTPGTTTKATTTTEVITEPTTPYPEPTPSSTTTTTTPEIEQTTTPGTTTKATTTTEVITEPTTPYPEPTPSSTTKTTTPEIEQTTTPGTTTKATTTTEVITELTTPHPEPTPSSTTKTTTPEIEQTTTPGTTTEATTTTEVITEPTTPHPEPTPSSTTKTTTPEIEQTTTPGTTTEATTTTEVITEPTTPHPEPTPTSIPTTTTTTTTREVTYISTTTPEVEQTTTPGTTTKATTTTEVITEPTTPYPEPTPSSTTKTTTPEIEQTTTPGTTTEATTTTEVITEPTTPHPEPTPSSTTKTTTPEIEQTTTPGTTTKATTTTEVITEPTTPYPEPTPSSTTKTTTPEIEQTTTPGTTTKATTTTEVITEPTTPHPAPTPSSTTKTTTPEIEQTTTPGTTTKATTTTEVITEPTTPYPEPTPSSTTKTTTPEIEQTTTPGTTTKATTTTEVITEPTTPHPEPTPSSTTKTTTPEIEQTTTPGTTTKATTTTEVITEPTTPYPEPTPSSTTKTTTPEIEHTTTPGTTTKATTTTEVITEPTTPHPEPTPSSTTKSTTPEIEQTTTPGTTTKATTTTEVITEPTTPHPEPTPSSTTKTTTPEIEQTTTPGTTTKATTTTEVITEPTTPHPEPTPSSTTTTTTTTTPEIEQTTTPGTTTKATTTTEVITEPTTPHPGTTPTSTPTTTTTKGVTHVSTTTPETEQTPSPTTSTTTVTTPEERTISVVTSTEPTTPEPTPVTAQLITNSIPTEPQVQITTEQTTTTVTTTKATTTTEVITEPTTPHPEPTPSSTTTTTTTTTPEIEQTTTPGTTTKATTTTEVITEPTTPYPEPTPSSTPTTTTTTTTTTTGTSPTSRVPSTTVCVCVINGVHYEPGETIFDMVHIGSGICLTMICSGVCEIKNKTVPCPTPTSSTTPNYDCPTWEVNQNETFEICNCTMARCIEDNIIEIIPYECPPLKNITCSNGKKPVLVWDENYCCEEYACDCFCEGWGDPHYKTFDGHFYSHQGNCTYVLMEEIRPKHNLKIYIDNVNCDPREFVSCPRALIVSYNGVVITLRNNNLIGAAKLEALFGHTSLKLPFAKNGLRVLGTGVKMIVEIPQLEAVLAFGVTGFSVNLPFRHFGENTQGHCGTCNNNKNDDCMLPGGKLIDDCAVMADYWPAKDLYNPDCPQPPTVPPTSAPTKKPCPANPVCELLKTDLFKECHPYVSPDNYFTGCQFDSCHVTNPAVVCTSLQTYASACSQFGICLHWRNHTNLCTVSCEGNKVYKPCGPAEPPTCQDKPDGQSMNVTTEGCFCPDGTMLFNKDSGVCVDKCGCLDPSGQARELGEKFEHNCQDCICEAATASVTCQPKQCSNSNPVICNEPGFIVANETDPTDECCTIFTCRCDSSLCPSVDGKCNIGYAPVLTVPEGKCCPELRCDPKKVCVHKNIEYEPGTTTPVVDCQECHCTWEVDPNSKLYKIRCGMVTCNEDCEPGFEYIEPLGEECCGKCVQTKCVIGHNGTRHVLQVGAEWVPRKPGCDRFICANIGGEFIPTNYKIQCPPFNIDDCQPGTVQLSADGCCQVCVEKERGCKVETTSDYISDNDCWSESRVEQTYCEGDCNSYSKYSELGSSSCSCCQASRTSNRVVTLNCANGVSVKHTYTYVEECSCNQTECQATKQSAETKS